MKKFLDLHIGDLFITHSNVCVWVKVAYEAGRCITPDKYGCCNFTLDKEDEFVDLIDGKKLEELIIKNKGLLCEN